MQYQHSDLKNMILRYASGSLDGEEREALELHLAVCAECSAELSDIKELNALLDGLSLEPPSELKSGVMARIKVEKRQKLIKRLTRVALPAAMLALVISASIAYPFMLEKNKDQVIPNDGSKTDSMYAQDAEQPDLDNSDIDQTTSPDIFFFFSSEGYLNGGENKNDDSKDNAFDAPLDPVVPPFESGAEEDDELPDGIDSSLLDKFRMQIKLVRSYIFLKKLPDTIGDPMLIYSYEGYMIYIYSADDVTLPDNMETLYSGGDFSLVIVG